MTTSGGLFRLSGEKGYCEYNVQYHCESIREANLMTAFYLHSTQVIVISYKLLRHNGMADGAFWYGN